MVAVSVADGQRDLQPHDGRREEEYCITCKGLWGDGCNFLRYPMLVWIVVFAALDIWIAGSRPSRMAYYRRLCHHTLA